MQTQLQDRGVIRILKMTSHPLNAITKKLPRLVAAAKNVSRFKTNQLFGFLKSAGTDLSFKLDSFGAPGKPP